MKLVKNFAFAVLMAMLAINTAQAVTPPGTAVAAKASGMIAGGSNVSLTWTAPAAATYKVWLQVPKESTADIALYRVYPNGNLIGNTHCSSTDATYPCFEIEVYQPEYQGKWLLLNLHGNVQWSFSKNGFVAINSANRGSYPGSNSGVLGIGVVRFEKTALAIGQPYQGGIIFYLDATGQHGLIAASTDQGISQWYNGAAIITGAAGSDIGTGQANTTAIINSQGVGSYAASVCDDLVIGAYSDWYLPSLSELNLMSINIGKSAMASFSSGYYWSSSEDNSSQAFSQPFNAFHGWFRSESKLLAHNIRAIRSF